MSTAAQHPSTRVAADHATTAAIYQGSPFESLPEKENWPRSSLSLA